MATELSFEEASGTPNELTFDEAKAPPTELSFEEASTPDTWGTMAMDAAKSFFRPIRDFRTIVNEKLESGVQNVGERLGLLDPTPRNDLKYWLDENARNLQTSGNNPWVDTTANAAGVIIPGAMAAYAAPVLLPGMAVPTATKVGAGLVGAGSQGTLSYGQAIQGGATEGQALGQGAWDAFWGSADAAVPGGSSLVPLLLRGGAVNAIQQGLSNVGAKDVFAWDKERGYGEGVLQSAAVGTLAAPIMRPDLVGKVFSDRAEAARIRDVDAQRAQAALDASNAEQAAVAAQQEAIARQYTNVGSRSIPAPPTDPRLSVVGPKFADTTATPREIDPNVPADVGQVMTPQRDAPTPPKQADTSATPKTIDPNTPANLTDILTTQEKPPTPQAGEGADPADYDLNALYPPMPETVTAPPPATTPPVVRPVAQGEAEPTIAAPPRPTAIQPPPTTPQRTETATPGTALGSTPPPAGGEVAPPPSREVGSDAPRQAATPPGERLSAPATGVIAEIDAAMKLDPIKAKTELRRIAKRMGEPASSDTLSDLEAKLRAKANPPPSAEMELGSGVPGIGLANKAGMAALRTVGEAGKATLRAVKGYSEPLIDRLSRLGGTVSKDFAKKLKTADDTAEKYRADLAPAVESGINVVRKANKATSWMSGLEQRGKYAFARVQLAAEGKLPVPDFARSAMDAFNKSNRAIGDWAAGKFEDFTASGKFQRNWTRDAVESIRMGRGKMYDSMVEGIADANRMPVDKVKAMLGELKANFDSPSGDASWRKANQEFQRSFPEMPTHIKLNGEWREVLHSSPAQYLEQSWRRTTRRGAVKDVIGDDLSETQKAVLRELPDPTAFDEAMRAVSGVPTVQGVRVEPGGVADTAYRAARGVLKPLRQLQLGASSIVNIPETVLGGAASQLGYKRALRAAVRIMGGKEGDALDRLGAIDRNFYDNSISLDRPLASTERAVNNTLSKLNLSRFFNELQEMRDAAIARVAVDDMKAGKVKGQEAARMARVLETMEEGTWSRADLDRIVAGKGTDAEYARLIRQAAPFFSGGKKTAAQSSRFLNNRMLTELFPFHAYGSTMANRTMKHIHQVARDVRALRSGNGSWQDFVNSSKNMGRFLGSTTAQGAMAGFIRAMVYGGGLMGLNVAYSEAKDKLGNPVDGVKYLLGALGNGMAGPTELLTRRVTSGSDVGGVASDVANMKVSDLVYMGGVVKETIDAFEARGKFKDMDASERAYAYLKSRAPAVRVGDTVMGAFGLSEASPKMDGAISAFYRWKREEDPADGTYDGKIKDENIVFRQHMRRAYTAMKTGEEPEVIKKHLLAAGEAKSFNELPAALRTKRILYKYAINDDMPPEKMAENRDKLKSLYNRIGPEAYEKLMEHDTIITTMTEQNLGGKSRSILPWTPPQTKD